MRGVQTSPPPSFFMVFCENVVDQLGLGLVDFGAVVAIVSGRNTLPTRAKPNGAEKGTSYASKASRKVFKSAVPFRYQTTFRYWWLSTFYNQNQGGS